MALNKGAVSGFLYEVNSLVDRGYSESVKVITEEMLENNIVEYIIRKYPGLTETGILLLPEDIQTLRQVLSDFSCNHSTKAKSGWKITNNGLCLLVSWSAEILRDWDEFIKQY